VSSARAVLLVARDDLAATWDAADDSPPGPDGLEPVDFLPGEWRDHAPPGFHRSVQMRRSRNAAGPAVWATTPLDRVEGEPMAPLERLAAIADITFGASGHLLSPPRRDQGVPRGALINTDTTIHIERPPEGEWFALANACVADSAGIGVARVLLYDSRGRVASAVQSLVANVG
jgi:hypothetical protein